jgi:N,N'-diacetylchitobiose transport system substrate-binding protein
MRSKWSAAGVMLAAALALTACGGDDEGDKAAAGGGSAKLAGSADVWIMDPGSPKLQDLVKGYATEFQARNPGTKVNVEFVPWAQAHDKFTTAIAGGKVPDVAEMGTTWTPEFADQGAFEEVPAAAGGKYVSSLVDAATLDGKVWGKPWYAGARALIYRKDLLDKAGVKPPTNWQELQAAAATIKSKVKGGVYPIGYTGLTEHMYLPTIWQAGGEIAK